MMNILRNQTIACMAFSIVATVSLLGIPAGFVVFLYPQDAAVHFPEWYYSVIKISVFTVMGLAALVSLWKGQGIGVKLFGIIAALAACLFNPFIYPEFMEREYWVTANVIVALVCFIAIYHGARRKK